MKKFIVKFINGGDPYYLASWSGGDPSRTKLKCAAKRFDTYSNARQSATKAVKENPHRYEGKSALTRIITVIDP